MASSAALDDVKSVITSLLVPYKNPRGIEVAKLNQDYQAVEGINIPYKKFNYPTLVDLLKTINCLTVYQRNGIYYLDFRGKESTKHLSELVARQRSTRSIRGRPMPCRRTIPPHYNLSQPRPQPPKMSSAMYSNLCANMLDIIRQNPNGISKESLARTLRATCALPLPNTEINEMIKSLGFDVYTKDFIVFPARSSSYKPATSNYSQNGTSHVENKIIPPSYSVAPPIVDCDSMDQMSFSSDFKAENQYNPHPMERKMPKQPISNLIGDLTAQGGNSSQKKDATPMPAPRENDLAKAFNEEDFIFSKNADYVASVLNERVQFRLTKLIQNRPEGIWCLELPKIYETEYKTPLEWENLGFQRLSDFASYLHHIFRVVSTPDGRDFRLYDANKPLPSERDPAEWIPKPTLASIYNIYDPKPPRAIPSNLPSAIANRLAPDDVMVIGEAVGYISVTNYPEQEHIQVIVVEAYSPSFFWIQAYVNRRIFDKMMADLHEYYEMHKAKYEIPLVVLEKGLNVACIYDGKWHRGVIKQVQPDSKVNVSFYDYGTRKTYRAHEVFFLHRMFSQLPAQAIPCGLSNVKPYTGKTWSKPTIDCFIDFAMPYGSYETPHVLWAQVVVTNVENNSMLVALTDTSTEDDVHIIDQLYEKKLAAPGKMVSNRSNFAYELYLRINHPQRCLNESSVDNKCQNLNDSPPIDVNHYNPNFKDNFARKNVTSFSMQQKSVLQNSNSSSDDANYLSRNSEPPKKQSSLHKKLDRFNSILAMQKSSSSDSSANGKRNNLSAYSLHDFSHNFHNAKRQTRTNQDSNQPSNSNASSVSPVDKLKNHTVTTLTKPLTSTLLADFDSGADSETFFPEYPSRNDKLSAIDWGEIRSKVNDHGRSSINNAPIPITTNNVNNVAENCKIPTEKPACKIEPDNTTAKNTPLTEGDSLVDNNWVFTRETKVEKTEIITPIVRKILNDINKRRNHLTIVIPPDMKDMIRGSSPDTSSSWDESKESILSEEKSRNSSTAKSLSLNEDEKRLGTVPDPLSNDKIKINSTSDLTNNRELNKYANKVTSNLEYIKSLLGRKPDVNSNPIESNQSSGLNTSDASSRNVESIKSDVSRQSLTIEEIDNSRRPLTIEEVDENGRVIPNIPIFYDDLPMDEDDDLMDINVGSDIWKLVRETPGFGDIKELYLENGDETNEKTDDSKINDSKNDDNNANDMVAIRELSDNHSENQSFNNNYNNSTSLFTRFKYSILEEVKKSRLHEFVNTNSFSYIDNDSSSSLSG